MVLVLLKFMLIYTHIYYIWFDMFNMMYTFFLKCNIYIPLKTYIFAPRFFHDEVFDESRASFATFLWLSQFSGQMFWMEHHHLWQGVPTLMVPNVLTIFWKKSTKESPLMTRSLFFFSKKRVLVIPLCVFWSDGMLINKKWIRTSIFGGFCLPLGTWCYKWRKMGPL